MKEIRALVFDLDGTLVDSKIDFVSMKKALGLKDEDDVLEYIETLAPSERALALEIVQRHEEAGAKAASVIEGALEFCENARAAKLPIAILTRNARSIAQLCLREHGFSVDLVVAREDCAPKPLPDGLFKIARSFDLEPTQLYFVGDYLYDLQAGLAADVRTALYLPNEPDFSTEGADLVFNHYDLLRGHLAIC